MTPSADSGILSPVRVGAPVEAVVSDRAWVQAMVDAEAALARAQARLGLIPESVAAAITVAAAKQQIDPRAIAIASRETANPVVGLIREFTEVVAADDPTAAPYVHRGSTSQDILDTAAMLVSRRALTLIADDLSASIENLSELADEHVTTLQAGRTLGLQAVPITFGLKAAGWAQLLRDAHDRTLSLLDGGLPVSLGGAAGTLSGYLEYARLDGLAIAADPGLFARQLTAAFAAETGLGTVDLPWHSLRTPMADLAAVSAFVAGALGKMALDILTLSRTEIGEVSESSAPGRGASSAMPHKQNPVLSTLIRSASIQVPALAAGLHQCLLAADERDPGSWHAEWFLLRECLRIGGGAAYTSVELTGNLTVHTAAMRTNLAETGALMATERLAITLSGTLGRQAAKELVAHMSRTAREDGIALDAAARQHPQIAALLSSEDISGLLDPGGYVGVAEQLARSGADRARPRYRVDPAP